MNLFTRFVSIIPSEIWWKNTVEFEQKTGKHDIRSFLIYVKLNVENINETICVGPFLVVQTLQCTQNWLYLYVSFYKNSTADSVQCRNQSLREEWLFNLTRINRDTCSQLNDKVWLKNLQKTTISKQMLSFNVTHPLKFSSKEKYTYTKVSWRPFQLNFQYNKFALRIYFVFLAISFLKFNACCSNICSSSFEKKNNEQKSNFRIFTSTLSGKKRYRKGLLK